MFHRWILITLFFIATVAITGTTEVNVLPTAETFSSDLRFQSSDVEQDDNYHLVVFNRDNDVLTSTQTETGHYKELVVKLTAFNETFVLDLKLNTYLFSSTYIEKAITDSGEVYNDVDHITGHCYYTGQVRNRSESSAAVSTCKGITGYIAIGNASYHIEPTSDHLHGRHRVYKSRDDVRTKFRCGTDKQVYWMSNNKLTADRSNRRMKRAFLYPQDRDKVDKVVEFYVVNDNSQYQARSSNVDNVYRRTKETVNIASLAYQAVGIYIVLVGVEVWTDRNQFTIRSSNVTAVLDSWYAYRKNSINPFHYNDNAALITTVVFDGGIVGKAIVGSMCSNVYSGSVVSDISTRAAAVGSTLAHEMGHNFGLIHDDAQCSCDDANARFRCIMYPSSDSQRPGTKWSSCSVNGLTNSFNRGLDICLYNIPQTIFQASSLCGNGIVEDGEDCDCGNSPSNECNSNCCNKTTCQLQASATCASGRCCDVSNCRVRSSGTECRSTSNSCDLAEYCNGVNSLCPGNSYKPDGTDCTNIEAAYCYQGQCRSHRSQCELIWGSGTEVSTSTCYTRFNSDGKHYGNCGIRWTNTGAEYISCAAKDVMCGKLQCRDNSKSLFYYKNYYQLSAASIGSDSCHSVVFDFGIGTPDPGMVPNGAKCGDRQMCVNQKCVDVTVTAVLVSSTSSTTRSTTRTTTSTTPSTTRTTTAFSTTEDSNSTFLGAHQSNKSPGQLIGVIVGVTVGVAVGLLVLILLVFFGCRHRRNKNTFSTKKSRVNGHPTPSTDVGFRAATDPTNAFENHGYTSYDDHAGNSYAGISPLRQAPRFPNDVLSPTREAPVPSTSSFFNLPQQPEESDYSNSGELSSGQPRFSQALRMQPTSHAIYSNEEEGSNQNRAPPKFLPTVPFKVPSQTPPKKPRVVDPSPAKADASAQEAPIRRPPQLPKKPPVVPQATGVTPQLPPKPLIHRTQLKRVVSLYPTHPSKPPNSRSGETDAHALQPPVTSTPQKVPSVTATPRNVPPKSNASPKPPIKPINFARDANQSGSKETVELNGDETTTLSVRQLMTQFGGNSQKVEFPPAKQGKPPIAAKRHPAFSHV